MILPLLKTPHVQKVVRNITQLKESKNPNNLLLIAHRVPCNCPRREVNLQTLQIQGKKEDRKKLKEYLLNLASEPANDECSRAVQSVDTKDTRLMHGK
jgi:hypothetical protein